VTVRGAGVAVLLCVGLGGCDGGAAPADTRLTVWSELLRADRVTAALPTLAAARTDLNLGVTRCADPASCPD
jgi:ABC-type glycerol-3-phosphate transport system substrate-binding protein